MFRDYIIAYSQAPIEQQRAAGSIMGMFISLLEQETGVDFRVSCKQAVKGFDRLCAVAGRGYKQ